LHGTVILNRSIATLEQLDIGGNDLNGTIPTQIGSLSNLTVFSIGEFYDTLLYSAVLWIAAAHFWLSV